MFSIDPDLSNPFEQTKTRQFCHTFLAQFHQVLHGLPAIFIRLWCHTLLDPVSISVIFFCDIFVQFFHVWRTQLVGRQEGHPVCEIFCTKTPYARFYERGITRESADSRVKYILGLSSSQVCVCSLYLTLPLERAGVISRVNRGSDVHKMLPATDPGITQESPRS